MLTVDILFVLIKVGAVLMGLFSLLHIVFSFSTLHYQSEDLRLGGFWEYIFDKLYYNDDILLMFGTPLIGLPLIFYLTMFFESNNLAISKIDWWFTVILLSISFFLNILASEIFLDLQLDNSDDYAKHLISLILYRKLVKSYNTDTAHLLKLFYVKGNDYLRYGGKQAPLQKSLDNLVLLALNNKDNPEYASIIERTLKSKEFLDLSTPLLNILNNEDLYSFVKTKKGSETIKEYVKELDEFITSLKKQVNKVNNIKSTLTESELIIELEQITSTKPSSYFSNI